MQAVKRRGKLIHALAEYVNIILNAQPKRFYSKFDKPRKNELGFRPKNEAPRKLFEDPRNKLVAGYCEVTKRHIVYLCHPTFKHSTCGRIGAKKGRRFLFTSVCRKVQTTDRDKGTLNERPKSPYGPALTEKGPPLFSTGSLKHENKQISQLISKINEELLSQVNKKLVTQGQQGNFPTRMLQRGDVPKMPSDKYLKYFNATTNRPEKGMTIPPQKPMLSTVNPITVTKETNKQVGDGPVVEKCKDLGKIHVPLNPESLNAGTSGMNNPKTVGLEPKNAFTLPSSGRGDEKLGKSLAKEVVPAKKYSMNLTKKPVIFSSRELLFNKERMNKEDSKNAMPSVDLVKLIAKLNEGVIKSDSTVIPSVPAPAPTPAAAVASNPVALKPKSPLTVVTKNTDPISKKPQIVKSVDKIAEQAVSLGDALKPRNEQDNVVVYKRVPHVRRQYVVVNNVKLPSESGQTVISPTVTNEEKISNGITSVSEGAKFKFKTPRSVQVKPKLISDHKRLHKVLKAATFKKEEFNKKKTFLVDSGEVFKAGRGGRSNGHGLSTRRPKITQPKHLVLTQRNSRKKKPAISQPNVSRDKTALPLRSVLLNSPSQLNKPRRSVQSSEFQTLGSDNIKSLSQFQESTPQPLTSKPMTSPPPSVTLQDSNRTVSILPSDEFKIETSLVCIPPSKPPLFPSIKAVSPAHRPPHKRDSFEVLKVEPVKEPQDEFKSVNSKSAPNATPVVIKGDEGPSKPILSSCRPKIKPKFPPKCPSKKEEKSVEKDVDDIRSFKEESLKVSSKGDAINFLQRLKTFNVTISIFIERLFKKLSLKRNQKSFTEILLALPRYIGRVPLARRQEGLPSCKPVITPEAKRLAREVAKRKIYGCRGFGKAKKKVHVLKKVKCKVLNEGKKKEIVQALSARQSDPKANPSLSYSDVLHIIFGKKDR